MYWNGLGGPARGHGDVETVAELVGIGISVAYVLAVKRNPPTL